MEQRLNIITLGINDLASMTAFYQNVFGWEKSEMSSKNISFFKLNGILLGLFERKALAEDATIDHHGEGFKGFTLAYNARSEKEVDDIINDLGAKGAKIIKAPHYVFWGGYSGYVADLEENLWEVAYNPYLPLAEDGSVL
jgi:uncharacterized protein